MRHYYISMKNCRQDKEMRLKEQHIARWKKNRDKLVKMRKRQTRRKNIQKIER